MQVKEVVFLALLLATLLLVASYTATLSAGTSFTKTWSKSLPQQMNSLFPSKLGDAASSPEEAKVCEIILLLMDYQHSAHNNHHDGYHELRNMISSLS